MGDKHALLWMLLLATLIWCAWWHSRENRQLAKQWKREFDAVKAQQLIHLAWSRTIQLLAALAICTAIIMVYDWQLTAAENAGADAGKKPIAAADAHAVNSPERKPLPGNVALQAQNAAPQGYYPPVATQQQAAQLPQEGVMLDDDDDDDASPDVDEQDARQAQNNAAVQDVYNAEVNDMDSQSKLDDIKKRYEDILVTYFYLNKCNKADTHDYQLILTALGQDITTNHAPPYLRNDILGAAQGSYQEVYAGQACDAGTITPLYSQYTDYINSIARAQPAQ